MNNQKHSIALQCLHMINIDLYVFIILYAKRKSNEIDIVDTIND